MHKKFIVVLGLLCVGFVFRTLVAAESFTITGNGAGSDNSLNFQSNTITNVTQSNQGGATNNIDAEANTGGNSIGGGGGSIKTGDASTKVNVKNNFNSNKATVACCGSPTPKPTQRPGDPTATPKPTQRPGETGTNTTQSGGGGGNSSTSSNGGSSGQVLGLSATAGESTNAFYILGSLCLAIGSVLLGTKKLFV